MRNAICCVILTLLLCGCLDDTPKEALTDCDSLADPDYRDICYDKMAYDLLDASYCMEIRHQGKKDECLLVIAATLNDSSICGGISNAPGQTWCYGSIAIIMNDPGGCANIQEDKWHNWCMATVTLNASICSQVTDPVWHDICFHWVAVYSNNSMLCENQIRNQTAKDECLHEVNKNLKNPALCERITDPKLRDSCSEYVMYA
ncbi:MAG: hypothetical protein ABIH11_01670 [Candidatus Altiarchaeota archaeon]